MTDAEKTVFISYRRSTSKHLARAIFMELREHGYDVFLDVNTIDSGAFDTIILNQIAARAHFVVLLSPGALERCANEGDWLRREIEEAIQLKRNIVPVIEEGFDFETEMGYLPEAWREEFKRFNGPRLFHDYFEAGMETLRTRFLKQPEYSVPVKSPPTPEQAEVRQRIEQVARQDAPTQAELSAEGYFNRAYNKFKNRGDIDGAIADYTESIRLNPKESSAYFNRAFAREAKGDLDGAIADYTEAILLNPSDATAYNNRGISRKAKGELGAAIMDYSEAVRLDPQYAEAYMNRGLARQKLGELSGALGDYEQYLKSGAGHSNDNQAEVEQAINELKAQLNQ